MAVVGSEATKNQARRGCRVAAARPPRAPAEKRAAT